MIRIAVSKTVVAYPGEIRFALQVEADPHRIRTFASLEEMAATLRNAAPKSLPPQEPRYIKNDVPGDIVWSPDDTLPDRVAEYTRLTRDEVHQLALLLSK